MENDIAALMDSARGAEAAGRTAEAEALYQRVLAADPTHVMAHLGLGLLLFQRGRSDLAAPLFRRAAELDPQSWRAQTYLGTAIRKSRPAEALGCYDRALALNPRDAVTHNNRGNALLDLRRYAEAEGAFAAAVALRPDFALALSNLGLARFRLARYPEALATLDAALELAPNHASTHRTRAAVLMALERWGEALASYDTAIALAPDNALAHQGRGRALVELDFLRPADARTNLAALASFDRALELDPGFSEARWSRALTRLRLGRFAEGWADYEHRWRADSFVTNSAGQVTPQLRARIDPDLSVADLAGRRVLLVAEQGVGDVLMFASIIPDLMALAGPVTLLCEARLHRLFGASFPGLELAAPGAPPPAFDRLVPLGSLGRLFRPTAADMPGTPFLTPSPPARAAWAERLGPKRGRLRVGVSWRGGLAHTGRSARSLELAQLAPILDLDGCEFISLQYGDVAAELAGWTGANPLRLPPGDTQDFDDLAALVQALDLVVSVQTAVVHLAGAVGAPALVMVPRKPEWRYGVGASTLPWYRSVSLFRQGPEGDWDPVLQRVAAEVARRRDAMPATD